MGLIGGITGLTHGIKGCMSTTATPEFSIAQYYFMLVIYEVCQVGLVSGSSAHANIFGVSGHPPSYTSRHFLLPYGYSVVVRIFAMISSFNTLSGLDVPGSFSER